MARHDKKIDRIEPRLQRGVTILKDHAGARISVVATKGASEGVATGDFMERCLIATRATDVMQAVPNFHDALQASVIICELLKRLNITDFASGLAWAFAAAGMTISYAP